MSEKYLLRVNRGNGRAEYNPEEQLLRFFDTAGTEEDVMLSPTENKTLQLLVERAGQVASREEILSYAWASRVVANGSLNQCIFSLRHIIGDDKAHECIQTVPRKGYRINADALIMPASDIVGAPDWPADAAVMTPQPAADRAELAGPACNTSNQRCRYSETCPINASRAQSLFFTYFTPKQVLGWGALIGWCLLLVGLIRFSALIPQAIDAAERPNERMLGQNRLVLFDESTGTPEVESVVDLLVERSDSLLTVVMKRWRNSYALSCVNERNQAFNTRVEAGALFPQQAASFLKYCGGSDAAL